MATGKAPPIKTARSARASARRVRTVGWRRSRQSSVRWALTALLAAQLRRLALGGPAPMPLASKTKRAALYALQAAPAYQAPRLQFPAGQVLSTQARELKLARAVKRALSKMQPVRRNVKRAAPGTTAVLAQARQCHAPQEPHRMPQMPSQPARALRSCRASGRRRAVRRQRHALRQDFTALAPSRTTNLAVLSQSLSPKAVQPSRSRRRRRWRR